jgi:hypothetical protein
MSIWGEGVIVAPPAELDHIQRPGRLGDPAVLPVQQPDRLRADQHQPAIRSVIRGGVLTVNGIRPECSELAHPVAAGWRSRIRSIGKVIGLLSAPWAGLSPVSAALHTCRAEADVMSM